MSYVKNFVILSMAFSSIAMSAAATQPEKKIFGAKCEYKGKHVVTSLYRFDFSGDLISGMRGTTEYSSLSDCEAGKNPYSHFESFGPLKFDPSNGKFANKEMTVSFSSPAAWIEPIEGMKFITTATIEWLPVPHHRGESLRVVRYPEINL